LAKATTNLQLFGYRFGLDLDFYFSDSDSDAVDSSRC
jgi:hypothetical protein